MSATSAQYWSLLTREAEEVYRRYLASDPMGRISLNPVETPELKSPAWSRLAKRLEALLITAAPKQVREELVQSRLKSPLHLLYRLHVLYAPGGVQEREHALRSLQHTSSPTTPQAALDALRQWRRWLSRTEALGGSLPDPVILTKALLNIVKTVLEGNAEVQFRMGLVKAALRAETAPTVAVVHQLHAALLSEVEGLARTQTLRPKATPSAAAVNLPEVPAANPRAPSVPQGKGSGKSEPSGGRTADTTIAVPQGACRFYVQGIGCNRGDKCRNAHNWQDIPNKDKKSRCMSCGGTGHQKASCPHASGGPGPPKAPNPAPPRRADKPERPKAAAVAAQVGTAQDANSSQVQALLDDAAKVLKAIQAPGSQVRDPPVAPRAEAAAPKATPVLQGTPVTVATLIQSHLDAIRQAIPEVQQTSEKPLIKAIASLAMPLEEEGPLEEADPDEQVGLLDSGATHAVRAREERDQDLTATEVVLAGGATQSLLQNPGGTILTNGPSQPIVPLGSLVRLLGCSVTWTPTRLVVKHPVFGKLRVKIKQGCPVLAETRALELIQQLEERRLEKLRGQVDETEAVLRALTSRVPLAKAVDRAKEEGTRADVMQTALSCGVFEHHHLQSIATTIPREERELRHTLKGLSLPRRRRRALEQSKDWFVNLQFGKEPAAVSENVLSACPDAQVLHIDLSKPHNNLEPGSPLRASLAWAALHGRIIGLSADLASRSELLVQVSWLWAVASAGRGYTVPLMTLSDSAKLFKDEWWPKFQRWAHLKQAFAVGGAVTVFTNCRTDLVETRENRPALQEKVVQSFRPQRPQPVSEEELRRIDQEVRESLRLIRPSIASGGQVSGLQGVEQAVPTAAALDAEGWRRHIESGHLPFNRKCKACVMGSGVGLQHRKVAHPTSFSLSLDVLGPIQKGIFEDSVAAQPRHKYALVGAYRVPEDVLRRRWDPKRDLKDLFRDSTLELASANEYLGGELKGAEPEPAPSDPLLPIQEGQEEEMREEEWDQSERGPEESLVSVELEAESQSGETLQQAIENLKDPVPQVVLRLVRPMTSRKGPSLMPAIHSMVQEINRLGFPVKNVHSDQGREFLSDSLRLWLSQMGVRVTMSEAHDKKANGLAERIVGWSKQRARCLLNSAELEPSFWPYAMSHAAASHQASLIGDTPLPHFGKKIVFKRPMLPGNFKPWDHWSEGRYLSPSILVAVDASLSEGGKEELFPELFGSDGREPTGSSKEVIGAGVGAIDPGPADSELPPPSRLKGKGPRLRPRPRLAALREQEPEEDEDEEIEEESEEPDEVTDVEANTISEGQISSLGSSSSSGQQFPRNLGSIQDPVIIRALVRLSLESRAQGLYDLGVHEVSDLNYVFRTDLVEEGWTDHEARARREARERAEALRVQPRAPGSDAGATAGSTEPPEPRHNPRITRPILDQLPARFYDEVIANQPISRDLLSRVEEEAHDADLTMEPNDEEYDSFGLVPPEQEPALEASSEELASALLELGPGISTQGVEQMARRLPYESPHPALAGDQTSGEEGRAFYCGAMCRGGISSLRRSCAENPLAIKFEGGAVWEENEFGNVLRDVKGKPTAGRLLDVATGPQTLQAQSKFHLTEPWAGRRVILVGYTVSRIEFLSEDQRSKLRELGFVLPGDLTAGEEGEPETFRGYLRGNRGREDWERATQGEFFRGGYVIDEATQTMFRANESHERLAVAAVTSGVIQSGIHNGDMILREYLGDPRDHGPSEPEEPVPVVELLGQVRDLYADSRSPQEYHIGFRLKRTTEDVDREGNYLGDQFFFMMSRVLRRGDRRHRASYEGAGGAYYFSSIPLLHGSEINQGRRAPASGSTQSSSSRGPHPYVRALSPTTASSSRSEGTGSSDETRPSGAPRSPPASPTIPVYRLDPAVLIPSSLLLPASAAPQSEYRPSFGHQGHEDPEVNKIEVYTKDVEAKLEALGDSSLETTYTVSPAEARKHAERWRAALLEELKCLEEKGAIIRRKGAEAQKLLSDPEAVTLHSKGVYTVKPGKYRPDGPKQAFRRKARIVACGNESRYTDTGDVYAAGVAGDVLRAALLKGASRRWKAFGTDVHTAFLLAPLGTTRRYLLQPPAILKALNLISDGEIWEINRAIYGLRESPRWWTDYRNAALTGLTFQLRNAETGNLEPHRLEQGSTEGNVFKIRGPNGELKGLLVCYVDDFLILSSDPVAKALYEAMCTQLNWELDPLQEATRQNPLKFLGVGISPLENEPGFALDQRSYIDELLAKNGFQGRGSNIPCPKELLSDDDLEDPEDVSYPTSLREAQRLTGELLWLAQKSRPDVSFVVQYMASHTIGRPRHVCDVAQRVFRYLSLTRDRHLRLMPEAERGLEVFTDASFAPTGKHSQGGILIKYMGSTIQWKASKLPLIAISSAEAELQALSEGAIYGQSLQAVLRDITDEPPSLALLCDSTSAIALAEGGSSQRTRHLQVRAAALTQQLGSSMTLEHCPGDVQCADLLTKPLAGPRLHELSLLVGLSDEAEPPSVGKVEVLCGCGGALSKWLTALTAFAQIMPGSGQGEEEDFQGVTSDLSLYVALVVVIIAIVGLWEGIKVASRSCRGSPSPSIRALRKKDRLEKAVREALDKEVTSSTPSSSDQPIKRRGRPTSQPPSAQGHSTATSSTTTTTLLQVSRFSQTEVLDGGRITRRSQGVQTDPDAQHQVLMPPTGVNPGAVMTTMQRGGVVHLFNDCGTLGTPGYRQERTFCRQCLARANLRP
ncbi:RE1 [Symbiodinium sp. CCMP2592]|nr:RE1 [Symbiodinium sp. CCMP2592]